MDDNSMTLAVVILPPKSVIRYTLLLYNLFCQSKGTRSSLAQQRKKETYKSKLRLLPSLILLWLINRPGGVNSMEDIHAKRRKHRNQAAA